MNSPARPASFWSSWLLVLSAGLMVFGLALVVAPGAAREAFALLVYADAKRMASFGGEAVAYISLVHAVLGSVMFGWGVALLLIVRSLFARGERLGWNMVAGSSLAWFIPDTAFSLWSGFWQNALLNLVLIVLFAVPLIATYRTFNGPRA